MLPSAKTSFKGNLFKNIHCFQRVGFTSVVGMFCKVVMVWFWPLRALILPGLVSQIYDFSEQRWCRSCNRCQYFKFFVVLTLAGWGCKSRAGPWGYTSNWGEILKLPEEPSRAPEIVLVCKPTVSRLVLLRAESYQGYCVKL